jgi:predicted site-specific integrase-resolvase
MLHAFRQTRIILCLDSTNEGLVRELVSECTSFCEEFDTLKQRKKKTNVACIKPSGEIMDPDGVGAAELFRKFEDSK